MANQEPEPRPKIPVYEREVMDAEAKKFGGDFDKVSSTRRGSEVWLGIQVESRYSDASELELMLDMIEAMTPAERSMIVSIFCDSKRGNDFVIDLHVWREQFAWSIAVRIASVVMANSHGYSGIMVRHGDQHIDFGGDFNGDLADDLPG